MTFDELYKLLSEASLTAGVDKAKEAGSIASGFNPVERGVMEIPVPGIDNPEISLEDWQDMSWEVAKILDPTGVLSYKDAAVAAGRMYDSFIKDGPTSYKFGLSLLVFVLCVYAALPNVGLLAGGVGGLVQYAGKLGARLARRELTQAAAQELGWLAKYTINTFEKNPEQLSSIVNFAAKHELIQPDAAKAIEGYFVKNPQIKNQVSEMPNLPEYLENPELLDNTIKAYQNRMSGKLDGDRLIRYNELTRKMIEQGLTIAEERELRNLAKKSELSRIDLKNYNEALYANNIKKMADTPGPETAAQVVGTAKGAQSKFKPDPESTGMSRSLQGLYGKSTGNYYGITGVKGNIIVPPSPTMAGVARGALTPSQAKVRLGKNIAANWVPMNEPGYGGGTSQSSPTYKPAAQQPGQIPSFNYEMQPVTLQAPAPTNLPPVQQPPQKTSTGGSPSGVRFAPLRQRSAGATADEPFGRYTPGAKSYSTPDNTMQLYKNNVPKDDNDAPMPLFQQLSVQKHNDEQDRQRRERESRDAREETKKNLKSFKDSLEETDRKSN